MANVIKLRKGLDIRLKGAAQGEKTRIKTSGDVALVTAGFAGIVAKPVVKEGDRVLAGDALFVNKQCPAVRFASPVSGTVTAIVRGDRRKLMCVKVSADAEQSYADYGKTADVAKLSGEDIVNKLAEAGLFGYINQLPYAVSANPADKPRAIFVSALRDMPLSADFEKELEGNETAFQTGLTALSRIAPVYLGIGAKQTAKALTEARDVTVTIFDGPCPAGNVGVQVNNTAPVNKGEIVWAIDATSVIFFGRLFRTGKVDLSRLIAVAGSEVETPVYVEALVGTRIGDLLAGNIKQSSHNRRIINGNVLTGTISNEDDYLGGHSSEVCVIPEGNDNNELFGWIMPRFNQFSTSHSYFSWLQGKREYALDARIKGSKRNIIMSGEYDSVLPMDIYGEYLIKAILAGNIDQMEQLGIYEVAPEDFAVAEFVDSSKLELQKIVRDGLDMLRKENA